MSVDCMNAKIIADHNGKLDRETDFLISARFLAGIIKYYKREVYEQEVDGVFSGAFSCKNKFCI